MGLGGQRPETATSCGIMSSVRPSWPGGANSGGNDVVVGRIVPVLGDLKEVVGYIKSKNMGDST